MSSNSSNSSSEGGNTSPPHYTQSKQISPAKKWCFTLNNYTEEEISSIVPIFKQYCKIAFFSKEIGESGTNHLQGYFEFIKKNRPSSVFLKRCHFEKAKGSLKDNIEYCSKDNELYFSLGIAKPLKLITPDKQWQKNILQIINEEPNDRTINWFYEPYGGIGKSCFTKYLCAKYKALILSGKSADMKYGIVNYLKNHNGIAPEIIIFDIPRSQLDYLSYTGIEEVKNGCFFSSKYESEMVLYNSPHIIVFANEEPCYDKLSQDRWNVERIFE
ncbi:hypothetical protein [Flavobacterium sp.]|uniref:hypothetical protein n=1 Tax=Flavobacterium sp. TaxID=239 RepID=UPI00404891FC